MDNDGIIKWLLAGDVSIQYQVYRDLLSEERKDLQERIASEGWGKRFLSKRKPEGHWGQKFYQPKWTSSHYTLLDLRNLFIDPENQLIKDSIEIILENEKGQDGGIRPIGSIQASDVCINGMFLNYASYFRADEKKLESVVDFLISQHMDDGGFNCMLNRSGAVHSSLHSTISVLEGITEYAKNSYIYRINELISITKAAIEFILSHKLYISDRTGEIIKKEFLRLSYPSRWRYDILRALDYFQYSEIPLDDRMKQAINVLLNKRNRDSTWNLQAKHSGQVHFEMGKPGKPSRWNTLRAMRVLRFYGIDHI